MTDNHSHDEDIPTSILAETDNYVAWSSEEPDGETVYHLELGALTVHLMQEEWEEFLTLVQTASKSA